MNMKLVQTKFEKMFRQFVRRSDYLKNPVEYAVESLEVLSIELDE